MSEHARRVIVYRLQRADETLQEADKLIEDGKWHGATNRLYYACFYAVIALLMNEGMTSKKHSGVRSLFNRHFLKQNRFPEQLGSTYNALFDMRLESDYADLTQAKPMRVRALREKTAEFIKVAYNLLNEPQREQL